MASWIERKKLEAEKSFLQLLKKNNNKYTIPKYLNRSEYSYKEAIKNVDRLYKEMNNTLDVEFGNIMQQIYEQNQEEYYIGIHRTGADIEKIMKEGISYSSSGLYGDINGIDSCISSKNIHDHVQIIKNFPQFLYSLAWAYKYKFSDKSLIIKIPKKDIDPKFETDKERNPIYYVKDGKVYLKPEFIIGYVPVEIDEMNKIGVINEFIPNQNTYTYDKTTQLIYDENIESLVTQKKR